MMSKIDFNPMSQRILITGGAGYVGSVLSRLLLDKGYQVRVLDNFFYHQEKAIEPYLSHERFELIRGDVRDRKIVEPALKDADFIIHLAALVGEPACRKDEKLCLDLNFGATKLINDLRDERQGLIFTSTTSVYGETKGVCAEDSPVKPMLNYVLSKAKAEEAILRGGKRGFIIYRPATAFGLSPRTRLDLMPNEFAHKAVFEKKISIYEPERRRTFIHVRDFARVLVLALEKFGEMKDNIYNVGSESLNLRKSKVAEIIAEFTDYDLILSPGVQDPDRRDFEASYAKIKSHGFDVEVDMRSGIKELIDVLRIAKNKGKLNCILDSNVKFA